VRRGPRVHFQAEQSRREPFHVLRPLRGVLGQATSPGVLASRAPIRRRCTRAIGVSPRRYRAQVAQRPTSRPARGPASYAFPKETSALLDWNEIERRLRESQCYWLASVLPDGAPHVRPVWGVWIDQALFFDGIPEARWARNIALNSRVSVNLEDASSVVILNGTAEDLASTDVGLAGRIVAEWDLKYGRLTPSPASDGIFRFRPRRASAWSQDLSDGTVWAFD